ncbi:MAG: hypothetical protein DRN15_05190 [Thermoprotei archaeon]|nr:MAG: hypothetical protein DRN15_05190 [Thermoprotei archaeon]
MMVRKYNDEILRTIKELRDRGYGYERIRKYLKEHHGIEVPYSTLHYLVRIKLGDRRTYRGGEEIPWNPEDCLKDPKKAEKLAYLIGVCLSDANVYSDGKGRYRFKLRVKDEAFVDEVYNALKTIGLRPFKGYIRKEKRHYVCAYGKRFYSFMLTIKKHPEIAKEYIKEHEIAFLKGFYEGDGCLGKRKKTVYFSNTDLTKIKIITWALERAGFKYRIGVSRTKSGKIVENDRIRVIRRTRPVIIISLDSNSSRRFLALAKPCIKEENLEGKLPKDHPKPLSTYKANYSVGMNFILTKEIMSFTS